jgi:hypothetical protein
MLFSKTLPDAVDVSLLANQRDGQQFTPDIWKLEKYEYQLLFLCDDLMSRHPNHELIKDYIVPELAVPAFTAEGWWSLWRTKNGKDSYSIPLVNNLRRVMSRRILGQIVAIRPYMFIDLDKLKVNGVLFKRIRSSFLVPYRKKIDTRIGEMITDEFTQLIRAWMYVGVSEYWNKELSDYSFRLVRNYEPRKRDGSWWPGSYYYFSVNDVLADQSEPIVDTGVPAWLIPTPIKQQTFTVRSVINGEYEHKQISPEPITVSELPVKRWVSSIR